PARPRHLAVSEHHEQCVSRTRTYPASPYRTPLPLTPPADHSVCTVGFAAIGAVVSWICSMPRTFHALSKLAAFSAFFTFVSVILAAASAGAEGKHGTAGYTPDPNHVTASGPTLGGEPLVLAVPLAGTTFVSGMNAFLNISYTFIGQITLPSFIAE